MWEGWKAGFMAFHAFHTPAFPWLVLLKVRFSLSLYFGECLSDHVYSRSNMIVELGPIL